MKLILDDIRCFSGKHVNALRPLTLLVGENSTGKSTFLSALSVVHDQAFPFFANFNRPPYNLGSFESIVAPGCKEFRLGYEMPERRDKPKYETIAEYGSVAGQIRMQSLKINSDRVEVLIRRAKERDAYTVEIDSEDANGSARRKDLRISIPSVDPMSSRLYLRFAVQSELLQDQDGDARRKRHDTLIPAVVDLLSEQLPTTVVSSAPIRSRPQRTYDQLGGERSPEGEHIPFLFYERHKSEDVSFRGALNEFGKASGLFSDIGIRQLGNLPGDPFQILVDIAGVQTTLMDVGYGISQVLPVLVETLLAPEGTKLLLQQPEVHLHPRGQAELGSFFVSLAKTGRSFVIETHSDYLIDRIRLEIARGKCRPTDVQILYFSRGDQGTNITEFGIDKAGNFTGAPDSFRSFFLKEQFDLLSL